jgi:hypothetical protein
VLLATPNVLIPLHVIAANGQTDLYGQVKIYSAIGVLVATVNLDHIVDGLYGTTYVPVTEGIYTLVYALYTDLGRTVAAKFDREVETLDVNSERINIVKLLGLVHENTVFDQQTYNGNGQLLTGRIRSYDTKTNADLASGSGLLFTWHISAAYSGTNLIDYKLTRDP